jgi:DNA-binding NarL/FixJ family response regulator
MANVIQILMVDDHPLVREGLRAVMDLEDDLAVVGEAADGSEAIRMARHLRPDVILMDLLMPKMQGATAIASILADDPAARILVLTSTDNVEEILATVRAGALGYVSKNAPPDELLEAIRTVYRGSVVLPGPIARVLLAGDAQTATGGRPVELLTDRELEVLTLVAQGLNNDDIAERLVISASTVSVHVSHILAKLEVENRTQAALHALRTGLTHLFAF